MKSIKKELQKLSPKERARIKDVIAKLITGQTRGLDIQKLKGTADIFRVRKGNLRILYRVVDGKVFTLRISRRSEKTYK